MRVTFLWRSYLIFTGKKKPIFTEQKRTTMILEKNIIFLFHTRNIINSVQFFWYRTIHYKYLEKTNMAFRVVVRAENGSATFEHSKKDHQNGELCSKNGASPVYKYVCILGRSEVAKNLLFTEQLLTIIWRFKEST